MTDYFDAAFISTADYCNVGCSFCFRADRGSAILTTDTLAHVLSRLIDVGVKSICLTGGEPTNHPHLVKILELIARFGLPCSMVSAARKDYPIAMINECKALLQHVTVSADSDETLRFGDSIRSFNIARNIINNLHPTLQSSIHLTFFNLSYKEISEYNRYQQLARNGALEFSFLYATKRMLALRGFTIESYITHLEQDFIKLGEFFPIGPRFLESFYLFKKLVSEDEDFHRTCVSRRLYVSAAGEIRRCPYDRSHSVPFSATRADIRRGLATFIECPTDTKAACAAFCQVNHNEP